MNEIFTNSRKVYVDNMLNGAPNGNKYYIHLKLLKFISSSFAEFQDIMGNTLTMENCKSDSFDKLFPNSCYISEIIWYGDMVTGNFKYNKALYNTTLKVIISGN